MTRRRPPGKRLSAAGEPMNEAELIKKIKACLAKGNKAAEKDAGILLHYAEPPLHGRTVAMTKARVGAQALRTRSKTPVMKTCGLLARMRRGRRR